MKKNILIIIYLLFSFNGLFSQCPQPGLRIQSALCDSPRNLAVKTLSCSEMMVRWRGNDKQVYSVNAVASDPATGLKTGIRISPVSSDNNGNYSATFYVDAGLNVSWSVQSVCSLEDAKIHSKEVKGMETRIPLCNKVVDINVNDISVYPNPANGFLYIDYDDKIKGAIRFRVYDASGKIVFQKREDRLVNLPKGYKLDLRKLQDGIYLLELNNGNDLKTEKFELFKNL